MDIVVDYKDTEKYFWARYYLEANDNILNAAKELAIGQSIGNPNARSVWETTEMIEDYCAKILKSDNFDKKSGEVWIGFPYAIIDWYSDGVSQLLCILMGGQMDIDNITKCHLLELDLDVKKTDFVGPKYGLSGMREWTKVYNKPLFGGIIKPKTGITPQQLLEMTKELIDGGVDFIKEDEILGNPAICPLDARSELIGEYLYKTSQRVVYTFCINADAHMIQNKVYTMKMFHGYGVHLNFWSGLGTYKTLRAMDENMFIHYQKSGDKVLTYKHHAFHIDWSVLCYLAGLCGADTIHAGMIGGYLNDDEEDIKKAIKILWRENVVPALSCGMNPDLIAPITEKIGVDWMANVGGFIHSDSEGTAAGAMKMRKAIDRL